jgi:hypothetical protein
MRIAAFKAVIDETQQWMQAYAEVGGRAEARAVTDKKYSFICEISCFIFVTIDQMREIQDTDAKLPGVDYVNDLKYKALVMRMLCSQAWAKQKLFCGWKIKRQTL